MMVSICNIAGFFAFVFVLCESKFVILAENIRWELTKTSENYFVQPDDFVIVCDTTNGCLDVHLPSFTLAGRMLYVFDIFNPISSAERTVRIVASPGDKIDYVEKELFFAKNGPSAACLISVGEGTSRGGNNWLKCDASPLVDALLCQNSAVVIEPPARSNRTDL